MPTSSLPSNGGCARLQLAVTDCIGSTNTASLRTPPLPGSDQV